MSRGGAMPAPKPMEPIYIPTPKGMDAPGVPSKSRVRTAPAFISELHTPILTGHTRKPGTLCADKGKQRLRRLGYGLIAGKIVPQDGEIVFRSKPVSLSQVAAALAFECTASVIRFLKRDMPDYIQSERSDGGRKFKWNVLQFQRDGYDKESFQPASAKVQAGDPKTSGLFTERATGSLYRKFAEVTHHQLSPLTETQRSVYDCLFENGIYTYRASSKQWGSGRVRMTQKAIAEWTGHCVEAVRNALRVLAKRDLIKIVKKVHPGSSHVAHDYVGICDWVESEKERYDHAMEAIRATGDKWRLVMDRIHAETMQDWKEDNKQRKTFHAEFRKRLEEAGVPPDRVGQVIPSLG